MADIESELRWFIQGAPSHDAPKVFYREIVRLRAALEKIANWPDDNMSTARTLHYDFRGIARSALENKDNN